jgi:threonine dehydratase
MRADQPAAVPKTPGVSRIDAKQVRRTAQRIAAHVRHTPLIPAPGGGYLKLECLQATGSFKVRGFFAAALAIERSEMRRGLLTVSAGNAALACAYVARELGVRCRVVMPESASRLKLEGVRALGATPLLMPREQMMEWIGSRAWEHEAEVFIHPFADEGVIAGHATLGIEILDDLPGVERVLVPVGGGGLASGIASAFATLRQAVRVIGVQSDGYPLWPRAFAAGGRVSLTPSTIADGTTAPFDETMYQRLRSAVTGWAVIPEADLRAAVKRLATEAKVIAEGAGALAFAALGSEQSPQNAVAVISGGNIDPGLLATLLTE